MRGESVEAADARGDGAGDDGRRQLGGGRQQPAVFGQRPFAGFVVLADDARAARLRASCRASPSTGIR
jgi:hypothetical protein